MAQITLTLTRTPSSSCSAIPLDLKVHAEARDFDELWNGKTDSNTRRRLQNRLNQRAFRKRRAAEKASKVLVFDLDTVPLPGFPEMSTVSQQDFNSSSPPVSSSTSSKEPHNHFHPSTNSMSPWSLSDFGVSLLTASWCKPWRSLIKWQTQSPDLETAIPVIEDEDETTASFEESFLKNLNPVDLYRLPADDHLLSLMYYNVFRALTANVQLLGLDTKLMHTDTYPSPFITGTAYNKAIPPHLQPTLLQQTTPHHPCFDIFPDPIVRDHGIQNTHLLPHGTLCMTLAGRNTWFENDRSKRSGLVIWGPPEDANSWEVTEGFVANWGWLVKGSLMLQDSTNYWRAVRGEPAIFFA